ncbi:MAG TPA: hypothetical protein VFZ68_11710 [Acidimicrobiales bacterium]
MSLAMLTAFPPARTRNGGLASVYSSLLVRVDAHAQARTDRLGDDLGPDLEVGDTVPDRVVAFLGRTP